MCILGAVPTWYCEQYGDNNTFYGQNKNTTESCERDGQKCSRFVFVDSFTSIVSEVRRRDIISLNYHHETCL